MVRCCKRTNTRKNTSKQKNTTFKEYKKIVELKSAGFAEFTFSASQILSKSFYLSDKKIKNLALDAALLFQIIDDIEDVIEYKSTKKIPSDIINRTKTYLWFLIDSPDSLSNKKLAEVMTSSKVITESLDDIDKYKNRFLKNLHPLLPEDNIPKKLFLDAINQRIENRTKEIRKYA